MINLNGAHGTSKTFSEVIEKEGFNHGEGRLGTGAYFWRAGQHSRHLAISWFILQKANNAYGEANPKCVVIYVGVTCEDGEFLDLTSFEFREELARLMANQKLGPAITEQQITELWDLYIEITEEKLGKKLKILQSGVATPKTAFKYPRILGAPIALLVRDSKCIMVKDKEEVTENELQQYA